MLTSDDFNLNKAIEAYVRQVNRHHLINREEREELLDHLLTETEILQAEGWSEREAFEIAIEQFGSSELISEEYERVKPFYSIRKVAIAVSLLTFFFIFIAGLINALSLVAPLIKRQFFLDPTTSNLLDIGIKVSLIAGMVGYLHWRFRTQPPMKVWEVSLIPILGLAAPFFYSIMADLFFQRNYITSSLVEAHFNNVYIISVLLVGLLVVYYRLIFKWRASKNSFIAASTTDSKGKIGIIAAFFLSLTIISFIELITSFSMWLASTEILAAAWVKLFDLVWKLFLLWGMLAIIVNRIKNQVFFKKLELIFIPLVGFASLYLSEMLFVALASRGLFDKTIFGYINYNTQIIVGFSFIMVAIMTYIFLFKERKQVRVTS